MRSPYDLSNWSQHNSKNETHLGWDELLQSSEEDLAETALKAFQQLSAKTRTSGSVHYETKRKSLKERWLSRTEPKETASELVEPQEKIIEHNVHVKVEVTEKGNNEGPPKKAVENYCVLGIYTKTYNKLFLCEHGKQVWRKGIRQGSKYRVLLRMIQFDECMGKWKDINLKNRETSGSKMAHITFCVMQVTLLM
eukprot:scaffold40607_cov38-Cyclotella_meneghiniana.AAC.2